MEENIWNRKQLKYSEDLEYDDFVTEKKDATVTRRDNPINEGSEPGWSFKNLLTRDVGSRLYLAHIVLPPEGGHNYHAHSGIEINYILEGKVKSTYRSKDGDDVQNILEAGDTIYVPHGTPHSVWNVGDSDCKFIVIKEPQYFLEEIPIPEKLEEKSFEP